jgi:hypothetical protein
VPSTNLQTQHSVDTGTHIQEEHNLQAADILQASTGEVKHVNAEEEKSKNKNEEKYTKKV